MHNHLFPLFQLAHDEPPEGWELLLGHLLLPDLPLQVDLGQEGGDSGGEGGRRWRRGWRGRREEMEEGLGGGDGGGLEGGDKGAGGA